MVGHHSFASHDHLFALLCFEFLTSAVEAVCVPVSAGFLFLPAVFRCDGVAAVLPSGVLPIDWQVRVREIWIVDEPGCSAVWFFGVPGMRH